MADPAKALKNESLKGKTVGTSLFDPISGKKIIEKDAKGWSDYEGVRYLFASPENKAAFDAEPKKHGAQPKMEALKCAVLGKTVTYASADGFADYNGVRYYTCCGGCTPMLRADPTKFVSSVSGAVQKPKPVKVTTPGGG